MSFKACSLGQNALYATSTHALLQKSFISRGCDYVNFKSPIVPKFTK
jgi:hypothetical protein